MYNRRYDKVFLMLRQEVAGYALGKRPPWGSCVMELKNGKGKLHLTVQGLKPLGRGYAVYVMAGEESIFCGEMRPDSREGHGELKWEFQPDALGNGKTAEDFHTVLILAEDGKGGGSAPLTAYFGEKKNWKKDFKPREKTLQPIEEEIKLQPVEEEIKLQAAEAAVLTPPVMQIIPAVSEKQKEQQKPNFKDTNAKVAETQKTSYHGSFQGLLAKFRQELENLEETGILTPQETENIRNMGEKSEPVSLEKQEQEKAEEQAAETEEKAVQLLSETLEQQESIFAKNRELEPFGDGEQWKCLSLEELILLSQIPLKWQREFFFLLPYRRYHHLILQEKEDGIWLGLPGFYDEKDEADAKSFGFGEFRRVDDEWGYWMAFLRREG